MAKYQSTSFTNQISDCVVGSYLRHAQLQYNLFLSALHCLHDISQIQSHNWWTNFRLHFLALCSITIQSLCSPIKSWIALLGLTPVTLNRNTIYFEVRRAAFTTSLRFNRIIGEQISHRISWHHVRLQYNLFGDKNLDCIVGSYSCHAWLKYNLFFSASRCHHGITSIYF